MEPTEPHTQSFILKIWLEEDQASAADTIWRGHITHVPGGEKRYVQSLADIDRFIVQYLRRLGVRIEWRGRLGRYLAQLFSRNDHG